jgi:hypothetical protein
MPRPGDCYEVAFHFMIENPAGKYAKLVHGKVRNVIRGQKDYVDHAWVEVGDLVWDNAHFDTFIPRDVYYRLSDAKPERSYTRSDAIRMALKTKHYGDWHTGWDK